MSRRRRILKWIGALLALGALASVALITTVHSDWGRDRLRVFLEETITKASGARTEIGELHFNLFTLTAELRDFVLHGRESDAEPPLFRARRISVDATALSWLGRKFRVDSVDVEAPALHIALYEDGSTNLPKPETPSDGEPFTHTLIDLGIRRFAISEGLVEVAEQKLPLDLKGEDLDLRLEFLGAMERYEGSIGARALSFETNSIRAIPFAFQSNIALERDELRLSDAKFSHLRSTVDFSMELRDFKSPNIRVPFQGNVQVADIHREFRLPIEPAGSAETRGEFVYEDGAWQLSGNVSGSGLALRSGEVRVANVSLDSRMELAADALLFPGLRIEALGGEFNAEASFRDGKDLQVQGAVSGMSLDRVTQASGVGELKYNASVSGDIGLRTTFGSSGVEDTTLNAELSLRPTEGETPLGGEVRAIFTMRDGRLELRDTLLEFPSSHLRADGDIREGLQIEVTSRKLSDFLPALALVSEDPESLLPVDLLSNGEIRFQGSISGDWTKPTIDGTVQARAVRYEGRSLDALSMRAKASKDAVSVSDLIARKGDVELRGTLDLALDNWTPVRTAPLRANATLRASSLKTILAELEQKELPVAATLLADLEVQGTIESPVATLAARLRDGEAYGEPFDEFAVDASYTNHELRVQDSHVSRGSGRLDLSGFYRHQPEMLRNGSGEVKITTSGFRLRDFRALQQESFDANGNLRGNSTFSFRSGNGLTGSGVSASGLSDSGTFSLESLQGEFHLEQIEYAGKPAGGVDLELSTQQGVALAKLNGKLLDSTVEGDFSVALTPGYPAKGRMAINRLTLDSIRGWLPPSMSEENLPVSMLMVSNLTFEGPLLDVQQIHGEVVIDELRLARITPKARTLGQERPFELTNKQPVRFTWDGKVLQIANATLTGNGTSLSLGGSITPGNERQQMNLRARGDLNFRIFNAFEPSLEAGGSSELDVSIRGTFTNPDLYGTLDLKDASIYLVGVPNGLDKVNGRVFLYRDRANIEEITAQSGGGELTLNGFVSYVSGTPNFRLSFRGEDVRVRYPPGVSTSADATLELTGSTEQSILSGVVSITRAAVNPRSDLASILTSTAKPVATPSASQNEFLRNMRFDVQVRTAPDVRFDSTLTQDLSGEADLRLRGNPYSPVLLGKVTVNQGEINFFGNKYFIDRGDISFINPLKLEPVLNLDLRTRVRSIDVTLTFSGPIDKLNVNYRSDPPLQLNEIIALLTVGRAPAGSPSLAAAQNEAAQSWQQVGASALVGQAVAAPIAGRLQKFFGVSRIKIDPRLTGVENNPQARLTVEQQVNRDITVTFITNLAGTQQQIVRLEWNFNPQFSMVALRDEDGLFGIDFLYRKRF